MKFPFTSYSFLHLLLVDWNVKEHTRSNEVVYPVKLGDRQKQQLLERVSSFLLPLIDFILFLHFHCII